MPSCAIAEQVATVPFRFAARAEGRDRITEGRLREFYERPHPRLSGFEFWELRVMWLLLRGECMRVPIYVEEHPVLAAARRDRLKTAHAGFQMGVPFNEAA